MFEVGEVLVVRENSDALAEYKGKEVELIRHIAVPRDDAEKAMFDMGCRCVVYMPMRGALYSRYDQLRRKNLPPKEKSEGEQSILKLFKEKEHA